MEAATSLILSSSTGGGHDMRGQAFTAWAGAGHSGKLSVRQHQALESAHGFYRFGVDLYNWIQRNAPLLHHLYFNELEFISLFRSADRIMGRDRYLHVLEELRPNIILSVHGSTNHGFFELARRTLGRENVRCVTYCGELFGGYGFSRHWVNPDADLFIGAVPETCQAAESLGMPANKNKVGGFLLRPEFYESAINDQEKKSIALELNLDLGQFILLLSTGANGANNHISFLNAFAQTGLPMQVIALCGSDEKILAEIERRRNRWPLLEVRAVAKRKDMSLLMQVASVIVARPGTGTTSEAIQLGCPILFNGSGGIMPQEWITVKYCRKHGFGTVIYSPGDLARAVSQLLKEPNQLQQIKETMQKLRPSLHPTGIVQMVCG